MKNSVELLRHLDRHRKLRLLLLMESLGDQTSTEALDLGVVVVELEDDRLDLA